MESLNEEAPPESKFTAKESARLWMFPIVLVFKPVAAWLALKILSGTSRLPAPAPPPTPHFPLKSGMQAAALV